MNFTSCMNDPKAEHTFVILAYKESAYLENCILSILGQTVGSRVLIATSTPNDFIHSLADKYQLAVRINPKGGSIGRDWNFGWQMAETPYVTLAHQDDDYLPRFAELCLQAAAKQESAKPLIVFTKGRVTKENRIYRFHFKDLLRWWLVFPFHFKRSISSASLKKFILLFGNSISCPGVFYVKKNLEGFRFDTDADFILDWKAWYEMSRMVGSFVYMPETLHLHREHENSATSAIAKETLRREEQELLTLIWKNEWIAAQITRLLAFVK